MPDTTPSPLPPPTHLTTPELLRITSIFVSRAVDKIRLTGGEPLLRTDILALAQELSKFDAQLGITTNGILLPRYLDGLLDAGLHSANISLDTLSEQRFEALTRRRGHSRVLRAIREAVDSPLKTKVNVVVMKGVNDDELVNFVKMTENMPLAVRFIEYMPFDGNKWAHAKFVSYANMLHTVSKHFGRLEHIPGTPDDTTKYYRVPGYLGRVGFITSMTDNFCSGCNRVRMTADGNLKVCLFGNDEVSLRDVLRSGGTDEDVERVIEAALAGKHFSLGGNADMFDISRSENRSMVRIGG